MMGNIPMRKNFEQCVYCLLDPDEEIAIHTDLQ